MWVSLGSSLGARILTSGNQISVTLGYPAAGLQTQLASQLAEFLGVDDIELQLGFQPAAALALVRLSI